MTKTFVERERRRTIIRRKLVLKWRGEDASETGKQRKAADGKRSLEP